MGKIPSFACSIVPGLMLSSLLVGCGGGQDAASGTAVAALVLEAATDSATAIHMSWAGAAAPGTRYLVYRDGRLLDTARDPNGKLRDTGLEPGNRYCYRVSAVDAAGAGIADSNQSCASTASLAGWDLRRVAAAPPVSLALDAEGLERMSFCGPDGVYYQATHADGSFSTVQVAPAAACFAALLVVGGDGSDHIVYADTRSDQLKYATDATGQWVLSVIPGADGAQFPSVAIDQGGAVHVAYLLFTGRSPDAYQLVYASDASGSWQTTLVEDVLAYPSIAVDSAGTPHIAYLGALQPEGSYPVHYRSRAASGWSDEIVALSSDPKSLVALALDPGGRAELVYKSQTQLEYVTEVAGRWIAAQVDSFDATGAEEDRYGAYDVSIESDAAGDPHLAYEDSSGNLKYAKLSAKSWDRVYVDTQGAQNQIKLDAAGHAHIVYAGMDNVYSMLAVSP